MQDIGTSKPNKSFNRPERPPVSFAVMQHKNLITVLSVLASIFYFSMSASTQPTKKQLLTENEAILMAKKFASEKGFSKQYRINEAKIMQVSGDDEHSYVQFELIDIPANDGLFLAVKINKRTREITFSENFFSKNAFRK